MQQPQADDMARLDAALRAVGVPPHEVVAREKLAGGTFNTVYRVRRSCASAGADGTGLVVKLAPPPEVPVLRYERGLLETEALCYALARDAAAWVGGAAARIPMPEVLPAVAGSGPAPADCLVMTECPGTTFHELADGLDHEQRRLLRTELGRYVAALHTVTGSAFGHPALPLGPLRSGWRAAFTGMVAAVLADAERFGVALPRPAAEIRELFAVHGPVLDAVTTPRLVHFDLWDGNILVTGADTAQPRVSGLIDAERAFWGDPLADFVSLALFGDIEEDEAFLAGYRAAGGSVTFDVPARQRIALYRAYIHLIMWVEAVPRGYDAARVDRLRKWVLRPLTATLDAWSGDTWSGAETSSAAKTTMRS